MESSHKPTKLFQNNPIQILTKYDTQGHVWCDPKMWDQKDLYCSIFSHSISIQSKIPASFLKKEASIATELDKDTVNGSLDVFLNEQIEHSHHSSIDPDFTPKSHHCETGDNPDISSHIQVQNKNISSLVTLHDEGISKQDPLKSSSQQSDKSCVLSNPIVSESKIDVSEDKIEIDHCLSQSKEPAPITLNIADGSIPQDGKEMRSSPDGSVPICSNLDISGKDTIVVSPEKISDTSAVVHCDQDKTESIQLNAHEIEAKIVDSINVEKDTDDICPPLASPTPLVPSESSQHTRKDEEQGVEPPPRHSELPKELISLKVANECVDRSCVQDEDQRECQGSDCQQEQCTSTSGTDAQIIIGQSIYCTDLNVTSRHSPPLPPVSSRTEHCCTQDKSKPKEEDAVGNKKNRSDELREEPPISSLKQPRKEEESVCSEEEKGEKGIEEIDEEIENVMKEKDKEEEEEKEKEKDEPIRFEDNGDILRKAESSLISSIFTPIQAQPPFQELHKQYAQQLQHNDTLSSLPLDSTMPREDSLPSSRQPRMGKIRCANDLELTADRDDSQSISNTEILKDLALDIAKKPQKQRSRREKLCLFLAQGIKYHSASSKNRSVGPGFKGEQQSSVELPHKEIHHQKGGNAATYKHHVPPSLVSSPSPSSSHRYFSQPIFSSGSSAPDDGQKSQKGIQSSSFSSLLHKDSFSLSSSSSSSCRKESLSSSFAKIPCHKSTSRNNTKNRSISAIPSFSSSTKSVRVFESVNANSHRQHKHSGKKRAQIKHIQRKWKESQREYYASSSSSIILSSQSLKIDDSFSLGGSSGVVSAKEATDIDSAMKSFTEDVHSLTSGAVRVRKRRKKSVESSKRYRDGIHGSSKGFGRQLLVSAKKNTKK
ncbi:hypothetical protein ADUPG1_000007 [Aduncisulcus paluster]|uniref:Uncharacterized protein n=1 Tax=Aduncisulcus paluster TaxID=2918883 RepID=A0ABQ5K7N5_9EUKA|nr:hypothetical protein ADUPG1_000007 [Aduncisulcus paluster]